MVNIALSWQQAGLLGAGLLAAGEVLRRPPGLLRRVARWAPYVRECAIIALLYALWQLAGTLALHDTAGAFSRARTLESAERAMGLPSEAAVQAWVLPHPWLVQAANLYYATMHFGVLFAFLAWLFVRHRDRYVRVRSTLALVTLACLLVQLIPVAPPRLLRGDGFVDTAAQYGQSVYAGFGLGADQLSAMPSVHVAWALLIGLAVVVVSRTRWRWLALGHTVLTVLVVVATANHFWLDGAVAAGLLGLVTAGQAAFSRLVARRAGSPSPRAVPESEHRPPTAEPRPGAVLIRD